MSTFVPSPYSPAFAPACLDTLARRNDGQDPSSGDSSDDWSEYVSVARDLLFGEDPRVEYEKKKAQLASYRDLYNRTSNRVLKAFYANRINTLTAELDALGELVGEERGSYFTTQAAKIGVVVLTAAGAVALFALAKKLVDNP